jgi:hypothetical protein
MMKRATDRRKLSKRLPAITDEACDKRERQIACCLKPSSSIKIRRVIQSVIDDEN